MSNRVNESRKLSVKNLVTIGIFTAIYIILAVLGGVVFASNPVLTFLMPVGWALLPGPVYLLLVAKVPKRGVVTITGILVGTFMFVTGMHWSIGVSFVILGVIADLIAGSGGYRNLKLTITSYAIFSLSNISSYAMFFLDRKNYLQYMLKQGTDPAYFETMVATARDWMLPAIIIGTIISALISGFVGKKLLKKQFEKAGIIE